MHACFIGLGSNIDPGNNLRAAAAALRSAFPAIQFSSVFRSAPLYAQNQPPFLNAVARAETKEAPEAVLGKLKEIEKRLKKHPPYRFGPRTIDLDLLLCNGQTADAPGRRLILPHPRMHERRFVLEPLCEMIDRDGTHPVLGTAWKDLLWKTRGQECERTALVL